MEGPVMKKILFMIFLIFPLSVFAATEKTYSILNDTANGKVYVPSLVKEINDASVGVSLDHINTDQDSDALLVVFQSDLANWSSVDSVVAAHTGTVIVAKYLDKSQGQTTIPNGQSKTYVTVTHNLKDEAGNLLTPNMITVWIVEFSEGGSDIDNVVLDYRIRLPQTENGSFRIYFRTSQVNSSGSDWTIKARVMAEYKD